MKKIIVLILLSTFYLSHSQETLGLILDDANAVKSDGYTLFNPRSDDRVFLIDNCGEVMRQWDFSGRKSVSSYILENGNILQSSRFDADIRDWDNNILWGINYQDTFGFEIHHDIEPLPNGNFLVLVRDIYTNTEMFAEGLDTSYILDTLVLERILEIQPVGTDSAQIVWEWKLFDHLVQNFDNTKPNFGVVADNPQLLDMNFDNGNASNLIHANALDYNEDLDQLAFSSRSLSEVFVIDHSTTTVEAASHTGGTYGKGGDFLWRWGNPEVYDQGTAADRKLGRQHDIKWITEGPTQGMMSVFSNDGYGNDFFASSIHILDQSDTNGVYSMDSGKFLPQDYFWSWDGVIMGEVMHAAAQSGLQILSNGNALINESDIGRLTEVDPAGNILWVYRIPVGNDLDFDQFSQPEGNGAFRAHRYPSNYVGFNGLAFNNTGIIENQNSISDDCVNRLSVDDSELNDLSVFPNPTRDILNFEFARRIDRIQVYSMTGKKVLSKSDSDFINLENLAKGMYIVEVSIDNNSEFVKVLKD
ncbi:aryl-sulfate sulfotransferase [Winogradskyella sp.]|uniref:aryl-sulfate sulfotransferase n=1 Tax=Winogradskyella sp. TaxID=1883156 RepID=UPI003BAC1592